MYKKKGSYPVALSDFQRPKVKITASTEAELQEIITWLKNNFFPWKMGTASRLRVSYKMLVDRGKHAVTIVFEAIAPVAESLFKQVQSTLAKLKTDEVQLSYVKSGPIS